MTVPPITNYNMALAFLETFFYGMSPFYMVYFLYRKRIAKRRLL